MRRTFVGIAAAIALLATTAGAFENTSWLGGSVACGVKAKTKKGAKANTTVTGEASLETGDTSFSMTWTEGPTLWGLMTMRNDRNYGTWMSGEDAENGLDFLEWTGEKVLDVGGLDVTVDAATLKGKFVLDKQFQTVKALHQIKFSGTSNEEGDEGKPVKGKIKIKGVLDRVL